MNELIKKIVYMLLALQEKFARRKHEKMLKNKDNQDSMQKLYKLSEELLNCKK